MISVCRQSPDRLLDHRPQTIQCPVTPWDNKSDTPRGLNAVPAQYTAGGCRGSCGTRHVPSGTAALSVLGLFALRFLRLTRPQLGAFAGHALSVATARSPASAPVFVMSVFLRVRLRRLGTDPISRTHAAAGGLPQLLHVLHGKKLRTTIKLEAHMSSHRDGCRGLKRPAARQAARRGDPTSCAGFRRPIPPLRRIRDRRRS